MDGMEVEVEAGTQLLHASTPLWPSHIVYTISAEVDKEGRAKLFFLAEDLV